MLALGSRENGMREELRQATGGKIFQENHFAASARAFGAEHVQRRKHSSKRLGRTVSWR
jgi:hypothetical protein